MKSDPTCSACGIDLSDENWAPTDRKRKTYKCKNCENKRRRHTKIKARFGITAEEYDKIIDSHNGHCDICHRTDPGGRYGLFNLDHDHVTNSIRGVLCHYCNTALGLFRDDEKVLKKAARYLHAHSKSSHC